MPIGVYKHHSYQGFQKGHKDFVSEEVRKKAGIKIKNNLPKTAFKKGFTPWNKGLKLESLSKETREKMSKAKMGENNSQWKGGQIKSNGRWFVKNRTHPFVDKNGYVSQSRLVMEQKLNRYLNLKEVVHHINGKKDDNRSKNLWLFSSLGEHTSYHQNLQKTYKKWR